jgi:hypothetical protein
MCRRALPIADDRSQHDSAVDFRAPPLARRRSGRLKNSFQVM